jgi:KDO2-lipid IV(A) lauroyltransferase
LDALLPRWVRFALATGLGEVLYWVLVNKRAATQANMRHVLGPAAPAPVVRLAAKRSFRNFAKYLSEFTHLPRWSEADLDRLVVDVDGWQHVEAALADGKGAIMVSPHFGNWDLAGWLFGQRYAFSAVVEPLEPPELDALVQGWRRAKHIGIIPLAHAARGVLRRLQRGEIVALVVDRPTHANREGVEVRFFGQPTRVPAGAAHFALRTGAPVVTGVVWRRTDNTYAARALPPLRFTPSADRDGDVQRVMQRIMADAEAVIRAHPDQWYMFRSMWPPEPAAHRRPTGWPLELEPPMSPLGGSGTS